jgi:hypothetical protein
MVTTLTSSSIFHGEESLCIQGIARLLRQVLQPHGKSSLGAEIAQVLPSLQDILVDELDASGPLFQEKTMRFVTARQLPDHSIHI